MNTFSPKRFQLNESEWTGPTAEGNYSQFRFDWVCDKRFSTAGRAFSIYAFIVTFPEGEKITSTFIQESLAIPQEDFDAGVNMLLNAGYLIVRGSSDRGVGIDPVIDYEQADPFDTAAIDPERGNRDE